MWVEGSGPNRRGVGSSGLLQFGEHDARLDPRGAGLGVDPDDLVEVARVVDDQTPPDGVAGDRRAGTSTGDGNSERTARIERGHDLVGMTGEHHGLRCDPVQAGVGGVLSATAERVVDLGDASLDESRTEVAHARDGSRPLRAARWPPGAVTAGVAAPTSLLA